ncbi:MAG: hypothetical protein JW772_01795, partial [Candidatus Diapherotrites archaeon]|nr:hypothetical protein [Candidatus Diapherotrites archaeon]
GGVFVFDEETYFTVVVTNNDPIEKTLNAEYFSPTISELIDVPETIPANSEARFRARIEPNKELKGQTYESTLIVELDNEKIVKKIDLAFKGSDSQGNGSGITDSNQNIIFDFNGIASGFATLVDFNAVAGFFSGLTNASAIPPEALSASLLDILLALIAAVLLLAFIARFVRRIK